MRLEHAQALIRSSGFARVPAGRAPTSFADGTRRPARHTTTEGPKPLVHPHPSSRRRRRDACAGRLRGAGRRRRQDPAGHLPRAADEPGVRPLEGPVAVRPGARAAASTPARAAGRSPAARRSRPTASRCSARHGRRLAASSSRARPRPRRCSASRTASRTAVRSPARSGSCAGRGAGAPPRRRRLGRSTADRPASSTRRAAGRRLTSSRSPSGLADQLGGRVKLRFTLRKGLAARVDDVFADPRLAK